MNIQRSHYTKLRYLHTVVQQLDKFHGYTTSFVSVKENTGEMKEFHF